MSLPIDLETYRIEKFNERKPTVRELYEMIQEHLLLGCEFYDKNEKPSRRESKGYFIAYPRLHGK
ncbi:MAG: hypothetical protein KKF68_01565 [Nanoarchaeota archaeon]|nr:hypothetical protein [Nanoarchaeota archaeon]